MLCGRIDADRDAKGRLGQQFLRHVPGDLSQAILTPVVEMGEALVVAPHAMQHRGAKIVNGDRIDGGFVTDFIRLPKARAPNRLECNPQSLLPGPSTFVV